MGRLFRLIFYPTNHVAGGGVMLLPLLPQLDRWNREELHPYLEAALHQLVDVQEGLLQHLEIGGEYSHHALPLQNEEPLRAVPTMHHGHRLPQATQHLLGTVAVVLVFPGRPEENSQTE